MDLNEPIRKGDVEFRAVPSDFDNTDRVEFDVFNSSKENPVFFGQLGIYFKGGMWSFLDSKDSTRSVCLSDGVIDPYPCEKDEMAEIIQRIIGKAYDIHNRNKRSNTAKWIQPEQPLVQRVFID